MSLLYVITGPAGVGKSTISKALAGKFEKSALIEGDDIYHMVCGGYVKPWLEGNHLEVFWDNSIDLITNFIDRGYDVVFNYICTPEDIAYLRNNINSIKIKLCVLVTDEKTIIKRDKMRAIDCQMGKRSVLLLNEFKAMDYNEKYYLDTTLLSVEETINIITKNDDFLYLL